MFLYKQLYRAMLSAAICAFRKKSRLSQEKLAERLHISTRSFSDLEHGKSCCSGLTLIFFLALIPESDSSALIREFREKITELDKLGAA